jgi:hypothetical protein
MAYTTIDDPSSVFQCTLYAGNGNGSGQAITHGGNSDLQADLIWIKNRTDAENHSLTDSVRGASKGMLSNSTDAETTNNSNGYLSSFNSDGFTTANAGVYNNASSKNYVSWNWKKTAGVFDIVTYTGNGSNRTISHNLGAVPTMMVTKVRSTTNQWLVYHKAMGNTETMKWDDTSAATTQTNLWNSTTPTSSVFSVGTHTGSNLDGGTFVMYLFGDKQGVSKCGSYVANGNAANNTFVYTGFKVGWVLIKRSSSAGEGWFIFDSTRSPANLNVNELRADVATAETTGSHYIDFLSNGFKPKTAGAGIGGSGDTYIYMAFAENPFVTSTGVPATAR